MRLLSNGSDLQGVERAEDILYVRILRISMWILGAWPRSPDIPLDSRTRFIRYLMLIIPIAFLIPFIMYLKENTGKLSSFEIGHSYITTIMNFIGLTRSLLVLSKRYNSIGHYFLNKMHLFWHRHKSNEAYKIHILVHKVSHFYTVYLLFGTAIGINLFNLIPLYNNYAAGMFDDVRSENVTFEHSVYFASPFDYTTNFNGYIAVFIFNWFISYTCSSYFSVIDLTMSLMVFHLWGHILILSHHLENFPKPASLAGASTVDAEQDHKYTEQESKQVLTTLWDYIHHHNIIIDFSTMMANSFGGVLFAYMVFHQVAGCLLLLECSQPDARTLMRYLPLTALSFQQLIQISIVFELLGSSSDRLVDSVYAIPWEYMSVEHRKLVFMMLRQSQRDLNFKALGMITIGVKTMSSILKTSFSYFIMLRTVATEQ